MFQLKLEINNNNFVSCHSLFFFIIVLEKEKELHHYVIEIKYNLLAFVFA